MIQARGQNKDIFRPTRHIQSSQEHINGRQPKRGKPGSQETGL